MENVDIWEAEGRQTLCFYLSVDCSLGLVGLTHLGESQEAEVGGRRMSCEVEGQPLAPGTGSDEDSH